MQWWPKCFHINKRLNHRYRRCRENQPRKIPKLAYSACKGIFATVHGKMKFSENAHFPWATGRLLMWQRNHYYRKADKNYHEKRQRGVFPERNNSVATTFSLETAEKEQREWSEILKSSCINKTKIP